MLVYLVLTNLVYERLAISHAFDITDDINDYVILLFWIVVIVLKNSEIVVFC